MDGRFDLTTLIFLGIAVFVFLRLRSVLGRRTGDDDARIERYRNQRAAQAQQAQQNGDKIVTLPRRERDDAKIEVAPSVNQTEREDRMTKFANGSAPIAKGLIDISRADQGFDPVEFMKGGRAAYEMIVMAFAEGNRTLLTDLLSPDVFQGFAQAIKGREERRETMEQSFVGISAADLIEAEMKGSTAQVTVKFVSELISAVRASNGDVLSGDPKKIKEVTDIWTFARDTKANNPNWKLVATQAAN